MNPSTLYQLAQVRRRYGSSLVLDISGLSIPAGEAFCLLGPTGAGKSTLLRLLAALDLPSEGEIRFEGARLDAGRLPLSVQRRITLVHQRPLLLSDTVHANVEYGLRVRRVSGRAKRTGAILNRLGLEKLAGRPAATLSGGQAQLVALARALVIEPDVLLLDEPTAHLDPAHVALVEEVIREVQCQRRTAVVWATHNLFQARRIATRAALLLEGELIETAAAERFFSAPADPRTADFIQGKMIF